MKEIGTISLDRMNNGAHFLFVSNILSRAEADEKINSKVETQIAALKAAVAQEDKDLKLSQKSLLTDEIAESDKERGMLYSGYKQAVKGFLNIPVENLAKAAKVLNQHIIDYNIDPQAQLDKETGMLINFITDLEGKYASEVGTLSLTPFVTALKAANERVRTLTEERTEERMSLTIGALKNTRKIADEAYRTLCKWVNAYALIEGEDDYAKFIDYVNTEIMHYKREVIGQKNKPSQPVEKPGIVPDEGPDDSGHTGDGEGKDEGDDEDERPGGL